jgi:hypothetical protein
MRIFLALLTVFLISSSLQAHGHAHVGAGRVCRTGVAYGYPATPVVSTAHVCVPAASYTSVSVGMPAPIATQAQYVQQAYVQPVATASYAPVQAQQTYSYTTVAAPAIAAPAPVQQSYAAVAAPAPLQAEVAPVAACLPPQAVGVSAGYSQGVGISAGYSQGVGVAAPAYVPSVGVGASYGSSYGSHRVRSAGVVGVTAPVYAVGVAAPVVPVGVGRGVFRQHTVQRGFVGAVGPAYGTGFVAAQPILVSGAGAVSGVHQGRTVFRQRTVIRTR